MPHVAAMDAYGLAPQDRHAIALAQNESLRGPSPMAVEAARSALATSLYPDPSWTALREGLAEQHDLHPDAILCGAGSLELIAAIAHAFSGPGRAVLIPAHAYPFFATAGQMAGARVDRADEVAMTVCVDSILDMVRPDTTIVFVANPANPTGTEISSAALRRLRDELHDDILLVLDMAYIEFSDADPLFDLAVRPDVILLRTFSKAYGLASARVGWGVFPPVLATELRKVLNPNNISVASQTLALGALRDQSYMRETVALTTDLREWAHNRLKAAGLPVLASATNFLLLPFANSEQATRINGALAAAGIALRGQGGVGLPQALRMTIGPAAELEVALTHLIELWQEGGS